MTQKWYQKASVITPTISGVFFLIGISIPYFFKIPDLKNKINQLEKENSNKTAEIQRLETLLTPFRTHALEKFPSEDINTALKHLGDEIQKIDIKTQKTVFKPTPVIKKEQGDGSYLYHFELTPIGHNIIPILSIQCKTQNQAAIKEFKVYGSTVPLMSYDRYSNDKTLSMREFRTLYPGKISVEIVTDKDAGQIQLTIDPLQK